MPVGSDEMKRFAAEELRNSQTIASNYDRVLKQRKKQEKCGLAISRLNIFWRKYLFEYSIYSR